YTAPALRPLRVLLLLVLSIGAPSSAGRGRPHGAGPLAVPRRRLPGPGLLSPRRAPAVVRAGPGLRAVHRRRIVAGLEPVGGLRPAAVGEPQQPGALPVHLAAHAHDAVDVLHLLRRRPRAVLRPGYVRAGPPPRPLAIGRHR